MVFDRSRAPSGASRERHPGRYGAPGVENNGAVVMVEASGSVDPRTASPTHQRYILLVPLKSTSVGKSRLSFDPRRRSAMAQAMALDTVLAATSASRIAQVIVLVDNDADGRLLQSRVPVQVHLTAVRGLNEAIREGASLAQVRHVPPGVGVAVLPADLPSLHPDELDAALTQAAHHEVAVVADRQGLGTTLLASRRAELLTPRYGAGSLQAHVDAGAVVLDVQAASGLRRDVDEWPDVADVTGRHTCGLLSSLDTDQGWSPTGHGRA